jgi:conjugative transfer region protein TrbK
MGSHLTSRPFVWVAAIVLVTLAAAAAMIKSGRNEDPVVFAPFGPRERDAVVGDLARCRTITPDDAAGLDACRRVWAENRQRFFTTKSPLLATPPALNAPGGPMKSPDQVPPHDVEQGRIW